MMPVTCGLCKEPFGDEAPWGWFEPDLEEWKLLNEEQRALFFVINKLMVHRKCYRSLTSKVIEE